MIHHGENVMTTEAWSGCIHCKQPGNKDNRMMVPSSLPLFYFQESVFVNCVHVYTYSNECLSTYVSMYVEGISWYWVPFLITLHVIQRSRISYLNPEFISFAGVVCQHFLRISCIYFLMLWLQKSLHKIHIYMEIQNVNSCSHDHAAKALSTEPSSQLFRGCRIFF